MTLDWVLMIGLGEIWGSALRRGTVVWIHTDVMWWPWTGGRTAPCLLPHHVPQQLVTAASHNYNGGQYLQHNESMYTWTIPLACFRERHTHSHTCIPTWERDLSTRAQWRKLKWHFLAFVAWLVLRGGGSEKRWGLVVVRIKREYLGWMWGR